MSWIPAIGGWWWALLAAVPIGIVLLYFLKLRREPVQVPSTFLWARTIEDLHVNSLLQRLRRSLLLLLQLLVVLLAALALLRPGVRGGTSGTNRMVFLLDNSASMQATDVEEAESRFDRAKRLIRQQIEAMDDSDTAMLVTFSDRAETVQSFTSDRRRLREALRRVQVTNQPTDILGALRAADGLANPRRSSELGDVNDVQVADEKPADLLIYSDGGFQPVTEFSLGNLVPKFISVGSQQVNNLGITAFSAERNIEQPTMVQAFATVVNLGSQSVQTSATLRADGEFFDAEPISLDPGDQTGLSFTLESEQATTLELSLDLEDDFGLDNRAYAGLSPMRSVSVLVVTEGNTPLRLGLSTPRAAKICQTEFVQPSFLQSEDYQQRVLAGVDDLIIYDRCSPVTLPLTNTFFIGALPPNETPVSSETSGDELASPPAEETESAGSETTEQDAGEQGEGSAANDNAWSWATPSSTVVLVDVNRTHPMMRYLELFSLLIFSGRAIDSPAGATDLITADIGPVLVLAPRDGYQDLVLGFEIISRDEDGAVATNTNWYAERSWPVFMLNLLRYLAGAAEATGAPSFRPGETVRLRLESAIAEATLQRVGNGPRYERQIGIGPAGQIEITETSLPGNYQLETEQRVAELYAINLFDRSESDIAAQPSVEIGYEAVEAVSSGVEQRHEFWRWALVGMLGLLATEWWLYTRRVA